MNYEIKCGDVLEQLATMADGSVQCCVTSPPYWGLRDYGVAGQIGLEATPDAYVEKMVSVFRQVRRVLRDDGTLWLNIGDSYNSAASGQNGMGGTLDGGKPCGGRGTTAGRRPMLSSLKPKNLCMIPWRVALALQADGWWLRSVIVWAKKSPMPESVTDRPTSSWEPIFLMAKSERYFYDAEAVKEQTQDKEYATVGKIRPTADGGPGFEIRGGLHNQEGGRPFRNQRNVWHLGPEPYAEAHFATFPTEIPRRAIMAGSRPGDTILDPFNGSGTTGAVALQHDRRYIGIELNPEYVRLAHDRIGKAVRPTTYQSTKQDDAPLFTMDVDR
jgi:DNA modification methylase